MKRVLGFNHGQYGDVLLSLPTIRSLKRREPDTHFTVHVNQRYRDVIPVLLWSEDIDGVQLSESYDNWPSARDAENLRRGRYDEVYHPMTPHRDDRWWQSRKQTDEVAHMHGLPANDSTQIHLACPYPIKPVRSVAISPIGGGGAPHKSLDSAQYQQLVDYLRDSLGYDLIYQLTPPGWEGETPRGVRPTNSTYEQSVLTALAADLYIGTDTGMTWCLSAFQKPTVGLYSHAYYGPEFVRNIQPTNPRAVYLSADSLHQIALDSIAQSIDTVLT